MRKHFFKLNIATMKSHSIVKNILENINQKCHMKKSVVDRKSLTIRKLTYTHRTIQTDRDTV